MVKRFIVVLLVIAPMVFAQDLAELYRMYIPKMALSNAGNRSKVTNELRKYSSINPDLIYLYINYLDALYSQTMHDSVSYVYDDFLNYSYRKSLNEYNRWISAAIDSIRQNGQDSSIVNSAAEFLKTQITIEKSPFESTHKPPEVDKNYSDYFTYMYYDCKSNIEYDPEVNYHQLRLQKEEIIRNEIVNRHQSLMDLPKNDREALVRDVIKYWYLFKNSPTPPHWQILYDVQYKEYYKVYTEYKKEYTIFNHHIQINNMFRLHQQISASATIIPYNSSFRLDYNPSVGYDPDFTIIKTLTNAPQIGLAASYRFYRKAQFKPFSYIDIKLGAAMITNEIRIEDNLDSLYRHYEVNIRTITENYSFYTSETRVKKANTFDLSINTPVFVINPKRYFTAGIRVVRNVLTYECNYGFLYEQTIVYNQYTTPVTVNKAYYASKSENLSIKKFSWTPTISYCNSFSPRISLDLTAGLYYASLNFNYRIYNINY